MPEPTWSHTTYPNMNKGSNNTSDALSSNPLVRLFDQMLRDLVNDPRLLAPINLSAEAPAKAIQTIREMRASVPEGKFRDFLMANIAHNLKVTASVDSNGNLVPNNQRMFKDDLKGLGTNSAVYLIFHVCNIAAYYIGSTSNLISRMSTHADSLYLPRRDKGAIHKKLLAMGKGTGHTEGADGVAYAAVYHAVNYLHLFLDQLYGYKLNAGEIIILAALTQLVPRLLEQAMLDKYQPALNTSGNVIFNYNRWNVAFFKQPIPTRVGNKVVDIIAVETNVTLMEAVWSIKSAARILQVALSTADSNLNGKKGFYSEAFGCMVTLKQPTVELYDKPIKSNVPRDVTHGPLTLPQGALTDLAPNAVWAFGEDKRSFIGPYRSYAEVARDLLASRVERMGHEVSRPISRARNSNYLVVTDKGLFYIACNPNTLPGNRPFTGHQAKQPFPDINYTADA